MFVFFLVYASIVMFYLFLNQMCYLHVCVLSCVCFYCNDLSISESDVLSSCCVIFLVYASIVMFYLFLNPMCYLHVCVFFLYVLLL